MTSNPITLTAREAAKFLGLAPSTLAKLRLTDVLTGAICSDDVEKAKPFQDVFSVAIARYRLSGRRPVAIGDTPYLELRHGEGADEMLVQRQALSRVGRRRADPRSAD